MKKPLRPTDIFLAREEIRRLGGVGDKKPLVLGDTVEIDPIIPEGTESESLDTTPRRSVLQRFRALRESILPPLNQVPESEQEPQNKDEAIV